MKTHGLLHPIENSCIKATCGGGHVFCFVTINSGEKYINHELNEKLYSTYYLHGKNIIDLTKFALDF